MELKIRELTVEDNRLLIKLLRKLIDDAKQSWISNVIKVQDKSIKKSKNENNGKNDNNNAESEKNEQAAIEVFYMIINKILDCYTEDITKWFASLLNISVDEYLKLPFDTDLKMIGFIQEDKNFKFFFPKLLQQFKLQKIYRSIIQNVKMRYGSLIE